MTDNSTALPSQDKIPYKWLLYQHLLNLSRMTGHTDVKMEGDVGLVTSHIAVNNDDIDRMVSFFEAFMHPYLDSEYEKKIKSALEKYTEDHKKTKTEERTRLEFLSIKLGLLMDVLARKEWLVIADLEVDDEDNIEDGAAENA